MEIEPINNDDEVVDIDLGDFGMPKEPANDKIALIDADTLVFTSCLNVEEEHMALPESFYTPDEWEDITSNPTYDEDTGCYFTIDVATAVERAEEKLQKIFDSTGCRQCELHFSRGRENFRYDLYPAYKANRTGRSPTGLQNVKEAMLEKYDGEIHTQWEADEIVVYLKKTNPDKYILCAVDKDVLFSLEGKHFSYFEANYYRGDTHVLRDMHFEEVNATDAKYWPYLQCINGDTTDNIIGPKGYGPKTMAKLFLGQALPSDVKVKKLENLLEHLLPMEEEDMWKAVLTAYKAKGLTEEDAIMNMNLVNMHIIDDATKPLTIIDEVLVENEKYKVIKWRPNESL